MITAEAFRRFHAITTPAFDAAAADISPPRRRWLPPPRFAGDYVFMMMPYASDSLPADA